MDGTPLHAARTAEEAARLIAGGADVHAKGTRDDTPLHRAANAGVARVLIEAGAVVDARGVFGRTPLHWAAQMGRADVVRALLAAGAEVDAEDEHGRRPLHDAAWHGDIDTVATLLAAGADPHHRDGDGRTPRHRAEVVNHPEAAEILGRAMEGRPRRADLDDRPTFPLKIRTHPGRREALTVAKDAILTRWRLEETPHPLARVQLTLARINDLAVVPDGETFAIATSGHLIELRRWDDLSLLGTTGPEIRSAYGADTLAFSPDGRWLAVAPCGEAILLVDRSTGEAAGSMECAPGVPGLAFDPASRLLASTHCDQGGGYVSIERVEPLGGLAFALTLDDEPEDSSIPFPVKVAFSPDGGRLAVTVNRTTWAAVALFEVETGRRLWGMAFDLRKPRDRDDWRKAANFTGAIAFADARTLAIGTPRGIVLFHDLASGKRVGRVRIHPSAPVLDLARDADRPILWAVLGQGGGGVPVAVPIPGR